MPGTADRIRGNRILAALVFALTLGLSVWGVMVARTFLRAPGQADGAQTRDGRSSAKPLSVVSSPEAGSPRKAAKAVPEAPKRDAAAVEIILESAKGLSGEPNRAEAVLARGVEGNPFEPDLRVAHAQSLVTIGEFERAYREYEAALSLGAENKDAEGTDKWKQKAGGAGDPKLHFEAGTVANKAGLVERAEEHYSMAQSADPYEPKYPLYLAMIQLKRGNEDGAMASLVRAVKLDPDMAEAWGTLAEISLKSNKLGLAMQHIENARRLQPEVVRWRLDEAKILKRRANKGDVEKAASLLTAMDKSERLQPPVMEVLAECFAMMRVPEQAAAMYAEAAAAHPTEGELWYEAAVWYEKAGNTELAVQHARAAATRGSDEGREMLRRLGAR